MLEDNLRFDNGEATLMSSKSDEAITYNLDMNSTTILYLSHYIRWSKTLEGLEINANGLLFDSISYCDDTHLCQID